MNDRQRDLERALLDLGQVQHALEELLAWTDKSGADLDSREYCMFGDPPIIEGQLAKLKVLKIDIQAHQSSLDNINGAGRQLIEADPESPDSIQMKLSLLELNSKWNFLKTRADERQICLEKSLKEAQVLCLETQDILSWLNDTDAALSSSKLVGGLPDTAKDQLDRFMELQQELEKVSPKVDAHLFCGMQYLEKSNAGCASNLESDLHSLRSKWDLIQGKANDKKIRLEIALKEALDFHDSLKGFIDWLGVAEKHLGHLKPVSRILQNIKAQIEEHRDFQSRVSQQREVMTCLEKKGINLRYFSQKPDVILLRNLLTSVQYRWEKVVSKSAERTRALDNGYKEAKEFLVAWEFLYEVLDQAARSLGESPATPAAKDPEKIKKELEQHKQFQKTLCSHQPTYDSTIRSGKGLLEKAPKADEPIIKDIVMELKKKWLHVCNLAVERQQQLEESLLLSGQFSDALNTLMIWIGEMTNGLESQMLGMIK